MSGSADEGTVMSIAGLVRGTLAASVAVAVAVAALFITASAVSLAAIPHANGAVPSAGWEPGVAAISGNSIACHSTRRCVVVGGRWGADGQSGSGAAFYLASSGRWAKGTLPKGTSRLSGVACASSTACAAIGSGNSSMAIYSRDGGAIWQDAKLPSRTADLKSIACSAPTCVAVGSSRDSNAQRGVALYSQDDGNMWATALLPAGLVNMFAVACFSSKDCVAFGKREGRAGDVGLRSTNQGRSWVLQATSGRLILAFDVFCTSANHCVASSISLTETGEWEFYSAVLTDSGRKWVVAGRMMETLVGQTGYPVGVACVGERCVAVAGSGQDESSNDVVDNSGNGGFTWRTAKIPNGLHVGLTGGLSCPNKEDCIAVGSNGSLISDDGGSRWS